MIKSAIAAVAAAPLFATAAVAGPYVNIEANSAYVGNDYEATLLETHVGFEAPLGTDANWYIQAGPATSFTDGESDSETEISGKVGIGIDVTERLNVYGEVWAMTQNEVDFDEDLTLATKLGAKFSF